MSRASSALPRAFALTVAMTLIVSCGPDNAGIRRLPLEPDAAPAILTISPDGTVLPYIGATNRLTASITPDGAAGGFSFQWFSTDVDVAFVANDGTVTARSEGVTKVIARIMNLVDTATVTVKRLPATLTLDPDTLLFTELGATQTVDATVVDGGGQALSADEVVWKSSDTTVVSVSSAGIVTSVGQGETTVKATAGGLVVTVRARVAVGPAAMDVTPRDVTLIAVEGTQQLTASVTDAAGEAMDSIAITWLSDDTTVVAVSGTGLLTAVSAGSTSILVTGDTVRATVQVEVNQTPDEITVTPEGVKAVVGATVGYAAVVLDANDHLITNPWLTWTSTDVGVATVTSQGVATAVGAGTAGIIAIAGPVADTVQLEVVVPVVDSIALEPDTLNLVTAETSMLTAVLFDADGDVLVGAQPAWVSDDSGVASVTSSGLVTAVAVGNTWIRAQQDAGADSTYVAVTAPPSQFNIEVRYVGATPDATTQTAFQDAEARWEDIIRGDLPGGAVSIDSLACGIDHPAVNETIDDLVIFAEVKAIDGAGGVLGQAGPCLVRVSGGLAIIGTMEFDEADLATLSAQGLLDETIIHEMGHVLGFGAGTPWDDVLVGKDGADPYWPGTEAVTQYQGNGGAVVNAVPVEATGGAGTRDAHWREDDMGRELMTGFIDVGVANPLSAITIGAMEDMGYEVDLSRADAYTVSAALRLGPGQVIELRDAVLMPVMVLDESGRIRVIGIR